MKKMNVKVAMVVLALVTAPLFAEESTSTSGKQRDYLYTTDTVQGLRLGAGVSLLNMTSESVFATTQDLDQVSGFQLGYANIDIDQLGVLATANYLSTKDAIIGDSASMRLDLSLAYGFSEKVYAFGGVNLHDYLSADNAILRDMSIGLGGQVGMGFQLTEMFGITAAYVSTRNSGSSLGIEREVSMNGVEMALNLTF